MKSDEHNATTLEGEAPEEAQVVDLNAKRAARPEPKPKPKGDPAPTVLVDGPAPAGPGFMDRIRGSKRIPVIPLWARSFGEFKAALGWMSGHYAHTTAYHAVRSPLYAARLTVQAPRGVLRIVRGLVRWTVDAEAGPLRAEAVSRNDAELYLKLTRRRDNRVRLRTPVAVAATVLGLALVLTLRVMAPGWLFLGVIAVSTLAAGLAGTPADEPLISRAVVRPEVQKLTSDMVVRAMAAIGIGAITAAVAKGRDGITFVAPITREGPGWRADFDLPLGVTVADVLDRRARLASALRRPLGCVWPDGEPTEHEGRVVLWVGDRDLATTGPVPWSLARASQHDVFRHTPFGLDPRGRDQSVPLIQHNILVGSLPGQGKTSTVRVLACGAALDPSVELWLHENKGTGDLDDLECVSHRFVSGIADEAIKYTADSMRLLREEVMRRAAAMKKVPRDLCPDKRITRDIADKRSLRLWPLVAVFDECQNLFAHSVYGKQAGEDAEFVIKLGRALGVVLILATQRPDRDSLPTGVSGNVSIRFCLKVAGQTENDLILGTSAYKNGLRATIFRPEIDAGNGYLVGATATPTVVRVAYLDSPATKVIAKRALALRKAKGTLSGHAVGEGADGDRTPSYDLLADILAVFPATETKAWNEVVTTRLAELRPEYRGWEAEQLTAALKPFGVSTGQVWGKNADGKGANRRGILRAHIVTAIAERDRKGEAG